MSAIPLTNSTAVVTTDDALSTTINNETVILHASEGKYYGLNDVGTFIWEFLEEPRTIDAICTAITEEYDVESERCKVDVNEMISELAAKGLVKLSEA